MIQSLWNRMWVLHDEVKDLFRFFVNPTKSNFGNRMDSKETNKKLSNDNGNGGDDEQRSFSKAQLIGLLFGPVLFIFMLLFFKPSGLSAEGIAIAASTIWIATWWITEAVPIPVTSLLPLILFPLTGGLEVGDTASAFGDETIFLFMGGFMIALAMEEWNLHRRMALTIIALIGTNMNRIVLGFMVATGFLSMWIANTATAMMMVPIGLAIIYQVTDALKDNPSVDTSKENFGFGKALMLGIAYSASIGGIATLIGTPPNTLLAGAINKMYGIELSFAKWMLFGVPSAWVFLIIVWIYLVRVAYPSKIKELPGGTAVIDKEKRKIGDASTEEKIVLIVYS